jgi:nucleotide-binding universal stress UspA family protein
VAVMRLAEQPSKIHTILVPAKNVTPQTIRTIQFALLFADVNQADVTVFHVSDRRATADSIAEFETGLSNILSNEQFQQTFKTRPHIASIVSDDVAGAILQASRGYDLLVLRSMRRRTAGGLTVSAVTTEVIKKSTCSMMLFGEPHS